MVDPLVELDDSNGFLRQIDFTVEPILYFDGISSKPFIPLTQSRHYLAFFVAEFDIQLFDFQTESSRRLKLFSAKYDRHALVP